MTAGREADLTAVERTSERELVVTRTVGAPARLVFEAWTKPELFQRWWAPKSFGLTLISYEADVRTGGGYRLAFGHDAASAMAFFGSYLEVTPPSRLVWTNDESQDAANGMAFFGKYLEVTPPSRLVWSNDESGEAGAVTTVTFEDLDGRTRVVLQELYPSKEALDEAYVGMEDAMPEQFEQLDALLVTLGASV